MQNYIIVNTAKIIFLHKYFYFCNKHNLSATLVLAENNDVLTQLKLKYKRHKVAYFFSPFFINISLEPVLRLG